MVNLIVSDPILLRKEEFLFNRPFLSNLAKNLHSISGQKQITPEDHSRTFQVEELGKSAMNSSVWMVSVKMCSELESFIWTKIRNFCYIFVTHIHT